MFLVSLFLNLLIYIVGFVLHFQYSNKYGIYVLLSGLILSLVLVYFYYKKNKKENEVCDCVGETAVEALCDSVCDCSPSSPSCF